MEFYIIRERVVKLYYRHIKNLKQFLGRYENENNCRRGKRDKCMRHR